ncbi:DUF547 domain-containing protein [Propionigenium maris DSM 9537]|uniref:DUF547 domain-containing protein n=1 Tax=Propionigenium maris DSM 9537 TaxID=1123000 RepID=A0A9W6GMY2_9FUSO|nr:DUF547 domain-containing protein [Propionigenium maris]GLI58028.1 DUF547 domain-containing protein [Propionigenium maris DSM 9537]
MWRFIGIFLLLFKLTLGSYTHTWDELLKEYTIQGSREGIEAVLVDYEGIGGDKRWKILLDEVRAEEPEKLTFEEKKAFWINIYNIGAVKMVIDNHPLKSIRDAGSLIKPVWKRDIIQVGDAAYSLGYIEHDILRKTEDPLIHYAIVCASLSCPDLRRAPYTPENLREEMLEQREIFLANTEKGKRLEGDTYYVSKIYRWYRDEFEDLHTYLEIPKEKKIKYMDYNWSLNSK